LHKILKKASQKILIRLFFALSFLELLGNLVFRKTLLPSLANTPYLSAKLLGNYSKELLYGNEV